MKNFKLKALIMFFVFALCTNAFLNTEAIAKSKSKKGAVDVEQMKTDISVLMRKVYASSLFSPKDNSTLVDLKDKLDSMFESSPDSPDLPKMYYNVGFLYKERELKDDAIDCYKMILENYSDSMYATRAQNELKKMGVKVEVDSGK